MKRIQILTLLLFISVFGFSQRTGIIVGSADVESTCLINFGDPEPITGASGTLANGTTYTLVNNSGGTVIHSATTLGDTRWENGGELELTFSEPVNLILTPSVNAAPILTPLVWSRGATPLPNFVLNGVFTFASSNGSLIEYEAGTTPATIVIVEDATQDQTGQNFKRGLGYTAQADVVNSGAPTASQDWGKLTLPEGTVFRVGGRDAEAFNFSVQPLEEQELCEIVEGLQTQIDTLKDENAFSELRLATISFTTTTNQEVEIGEYYIVFENGDTAPFSDNKEPLQWFDQCYDTLALEGEVIVRNYNDGTFAIVDTVNNVVTELASIPNDWAKCEVKDINTPSLICRDTTTEDFLNQLVDGPDSFTQNDGATIDEWFIMYSSTLHDSRPVSNLNNLHSQNFASVGYDAETDVWSFIGQNSNTLTPFVPSSNEVLIAEINTEGFHTPFAGNGVTLGINHVANNGGLTIQDNTWDGGATNAGEFRIEGALPLPTEYAYLQLSGNYNTEIKGTGDTILIEDVIGLGFEHCEQPEEAVLQSSDCYQRITNNTNLSGGNTNNTGGGSGPQALTLGQINVDIAGTYEITHSAAVTAGTAGFGISSTPFDATSTSVIAADVFTSSLDRLNTSTTSQAYEVTFANAGVYYVGVFSGGGAASNSHDITLDNELLDSEEFTAYAYDDGNIIYFLNSVESQTQEIPVNWFECQVEIICKLTGITPLYESVTTSPIENGLAGTIVTPITNIVLSPPTAGTSQVTDVFFHGRNGSVFPVEIIVDRLGAGGSLQLTATGLFSNTSGAGDYNVTINLPDSLAYRWGMTGASSLGSEALEFTTNNPVIQYAQGAGGANLTLPYVGLWSNANNGASSGFGFDAINSLNFVTYGNSGTSSSFTVYLRDVPTYVEEEICERTESITTDLNALKGKVDSLNANTENATGLYLICEHSALPLGIPLTEIIQTGCDLTQLPNMRLKLHIRDEANDQAWGILELDVDNMLERFNAGSATDSWGTLFDNDYVRINVIDPVAGEIQIIEVGRSFEYMKSELIAFVNTPAGTSGGVQWDNIFMGGVTYDFSNHTGTLQKVILYNDSSANQTVTGLIGADVQIVSNESKSFYLNAGNWWAN